MADVKISALPASTTPLAGTEVLPIVQSNTTKKVSIADVTAGRAVSASSLTLTTPLSAANGGTGITSFGTGVATALGNAVNGASGLCVQDASGNLGLGVTPSAWSSVKALQVNNTSIVNFSSSNSIFGTNYYFDGTNFRYISTAAASYYQQSGAAHNWYQAASGTANTAISFTQAMTLDASSNLTLNVDNSALIFRNNYQSITTDASGNDLTYRTYANHIWKTTTTSGSTTSGTERARITSAGYLKLNTTSDSGAYEGTLTVVGRSNSTDYCVSFLSANGTELLRARNDGFIRAPGVYNQTSANSANVYVDSAGFLYRATSSIRYKRNVTNTAHGLTDVLNLRPVTYNGVNDGSSIFGGLIAEEVHDAGLTEFVVYDDDGKPDALQYGPMVSLAFKAIQELAAKVSALEAKQ